MLLEKLSSSHDGMVFYPSGNIAVSVYQTPTGRVINILSDNSDPKVLVSFDERGVGSINHSTGLPWVVVALQGWSVSDPKGTIIKRGKWPRSSIDPILYAVGVHTKYWSPRCDVTDELSVEFYNRQNIVAKFACDSVMKEFQCGEDLKRSDSYLDKVTEVLPGGKLQMDINAIRNRQKEIGSLYIPPGPHHIITRSPGTGILKTLVKDLTDDCLTQEVINDMNTTQFRLAHLSGKGCIRGVQMKPTDADLPEDLGKPTLTRAQKKFQALTDGTAVVYTTRRLKLPLLAMKDVDDFTVGPDAPSDMLVAVCVLAKWNPVCNRVEAKLEEANHQLDEEREANKSSAAGHIQVFKVDASEGWILQLRYDFRTVPMFLMYYGGKLVFASNAIRTKEEMLDVCQDSLTKGRKGVFLAEHFSFHGMDNFVLDSITNEMSLLHDI